MMKTRTTSPSRSSLLDDPTIVPTPPAGDNPDEIRRFLREQPPQPIPPRTYAQPLPGLTALPLLGTYRVIRHNEA